MTSCHAGAITYYGCKECVWYAGCRKCYPSYYLDNTFCKECLYDCVSCTNADSCEKCADKAHLKDNKCYQNIENCNATDTSTGKCSKCFHNFFITEQGLCEPCSTIQLNSSCQCNNNKISNCLSCDGGSCGTCLPNYKPIAADATCVLNQCASASECQQGEFCEIPPQKPNVCKTCSVGCNSCENTENCTECSTNHILVGKACTPCTPTSPVDSLCVCGTKQVKNCAKCELEACEACIDNFVAIDGICTACTTGQCTCGGAVVKNCKSCTQSKCSSCDETHRLIDGQCVKNDCSETLPCDDEFYCKITEILQNQCVSCLENCAKCSNSDVCETCKNDFFYDKTACKSCTENISGSCICGGLEVQFCRECAGNQCKECASEQYFLRDGKCEFQCLGAADCGLAQFCDIDVESGNSCKECGIGCMECSGAGQCDLCPVGSFDSAGVCLDCSEIKIGQKCQCEGGLAENCSKCGANFVCESCVAGSYADSEKGCQECGKGCQQCRSAEICDLCPIGTFEQAGACLDCTGIQLGGQCQCNGNYVENCTKCEGFSPCEGCIAGYYLSEGQCVKQVCTETVLCEQGQFCKIVEGGPNSCTECTEGCTECDFASCKSCAAGYQLISSVCVKNECDGSIPCDLGSYCQIQSGVANKCVACTQGCAECDSMKCKSCAMGYQLIGGICVKNECDDSTPCTSGSYCQIQPDIANKCVNCLQNCTECNSTGCTSCAADFVLKAQICVKNECDGSIPCDLGQYCQNVAESANKCQKCAQNCLNCSSEISCSECSSGSKLVSGVCITPQCDENLPCAGGQFCDSAYNCQNCSAGCSVCSSKDLCDSCSAGMQLDGRVCFDCAMNPEKCQKQETGNNMIAIVSGVIGGVVVLVIIAVVVIFVIKKRKGKQPKDREGAMLRKNNSSSSQISNSSQYYI